MRSNDCDARMRQVAVVAAEQLVAAVARQHDRDVLGAPSPRRTRSGWPTSRRTARRSARSAGRGCPSASGRTTSSWCSVPRCSATRRACGELVELAPRRSRSRRSSPARCDARAISATTTLESMPPERNAPSGTSLTMCERDGVVERRFELLDAPRASRCRGTCRRPASCQ